MTGDLEAPRPFKAQVSAVSEVLVYPGFQRGKAEDDPDDAALLVLSKATRAPPVALAGDTTIATSVAAAPPS